MFTAILSWFLGGGLKSIEDGLVQAYTAKLNAQNDSDRIAADQVIAQLQAQRDVMVASSGKLSLDAIVRAFFALPVAMYYGKIFAIDKVYCSLTGCSWSTDPLSDNLTMVSGIIISFYFVYSGVSSFIKGR